MSTIVSDSKSEAPVIFYKVFLFSEFGYNMTKCLLIDVTYMDYTRLEHS